MKERRACWRRRRVGSDLGDGGGILWLEEEEEEEVLVACVEAPGSCVRVGGVGGMAWVGGWMDGCNTQACTPRCLGELQRYGQGHECTAYTRAHPLRLTPAAA